MKSAYRASDQASVVITWLLCLGSGRMRSFSGISDIGFSVGISPWQTQLVWNRLGTDSRQTEAQTCVPTLSITEVCFTSFVFLSFLVNFAFGSDGVILIKVAMIILFCCCFVFVFCFVCCSCCLFVLFCFVFLSFSVCTSLCCSCPGGEALRFKHYQFRPVFSRTD